MIYRRWPCSFCWGGCNHPVRLRRPPLQGGELIGRARENSPLWRGGAKRRGGHSPPCSGVTSAPGYSFPSVEGWTPQADGVVIAHRAAVSRQRRGIHSPPWRGGRRRRTGWSLPTVNGVASAPGYSFPSVEGWTPKADGVVIPHRAAVSRQCLLPPLEAGAYSAKTHAIESEIKPATRPAC